MLENRFTLPVLALVTFLLGGLAAGATAIASAQTATDTTADTLAVTSSTMPTQQFDSAKGGHVGANGVKKNSSREIPQPRSHLPRSLLSQAQR